ncbi:sporulation kinase E [Bacteroidaceae bacterium]|uniref:sensor histidine kinase n=1 Tax=Prevotella sp. MGM2 TaxID=2033406 RepID=UPI000D0BEFFC|nr:HAMP domain-containing sensor histidine kinase [Prevotella sp. MGM2]GAY30160.1 ATP-binding protein [Prevotella sp. MGM2]GFI33770.1 sporulation kinase E [Bacteroidaceae bacterium]
MQNLFTDRIRTIKIALVSTAVIIAAASLYVSHTLISDLKKEEQTKMEVWTEAMRSLIRADEAADLNLVLKIINSNNTIPIIVLDEKDRVTDYRNIQLKEGEDTIAYLRQEARQMEQAGRSMTINLEALDPAIQPSSLTVCYDESLMLKRLTAYPYIQLGVMGLFIVIAVFALLSFTRAEQNKVWVGLSRETAHQLGTPISSLMAWTELLKEIYPREKLLNDMSTDVKRLELIAERFSKIGSAPDVKQEDLTAVITHVIQYISRRTSERVNFTTAYPQQRPIVGLLNAPLFEWVIENLCKNAIDAMGGTGNIHIAITQTEQKHIIEVTDTGKGMTKSQYQQVFRPGYTTKKRGWGLGLPLARRIVEQYHKGHIFVKSSEIGIGTTFCIELPAILPQTIP